MKQKMIRCIGVLLLVAATHLSYGQYINRLYDFDSTADWGLDIFVQSDSSYFILSKVEDPVSGFWSFATMMVSADGSTIYNKKRVQYINASIYTGNPGEAKKLINGEYILPLTVQTPGATYLNSAIGLAKLYSTGDTDFVKTYTDTTLFYDFSYTCTALPDGRYVLGGSHQLKSISVYPGYLICTDSIGDTLWTCTYQKYPSESVSINTVAALNDGRILVGAMSSHQVTASSTATYNYNAPWFMILDSMGNIIRDTIYSIGFAGGGYIYKDMNGGYVTLGDFDSLFTSNVTDFVNFPSYVAHLDTNFRITWIREFGYSNFYGHRERSIVHQLVDSNYVVVGDDWPAPPYGPISIGWASKIDRNGNVLWNHLCKTDTTFNVNSYIRDMVETPDGDIVSIGAGFNDSLPSWHQNRDVWLVGLDSNGCEVAGCIPTKIASPGPIKVNEGIHIWPNPSYEDITVEVNETGTLQIYDMQGQEIVAYQIKAGETNIKLPSTMAVGLYICRYFPSEHNTPPQVVRLIYQR